MVKPARSSARSQRKSEPLSNQRIVAAALRLADRHGLEALSIRRIASSLGAGAMSLYRHVQSKDELLDLLLDAAYSEIEVPAAATGDWTREIADLARQTRRVLKRHWWLGPLLTARPTFGTHYLRWFEFQLASTGRAGFEMAARVQLIGTVFAYVNGFVGYELGEEATNRKHRLTPENKRRAAEPILAPLFATGLYPNLAEFIQTDTAEPTDEDFEFGLQAVIAGLAAGSSPGWQSPSQAAG